MRAHPVLTKCLLCCAASFLAGCNLPGRPKPGPEIPRPDQIIAFNELYTQNCIACHGPNGQNGAASNLANPEYQALIDDASLRSLVANGEKGVLMPAFALLAGGDLTDAQVDALVRGMRENWSKGSNVFGGLTPPLYHAASEGDAGQGQAVYMAACARCHGAPAPAGSILDGAFLALINAQTIRTTVIAGRPDIGQPDFRNDIPGHPLTDAEITDVTGWLLAQTPSRPGRPYPNTVPNVERPGEAQPLAAQNGPSAIRNQR